MSHTIEDVLAVAGNRPVFEALASILEAGKAIAFVGAGASAGMYPLWGRFIELLAEQAVAEGKAEDKDAKRWQADTTSTPQQRVNVILRKLGELGEPLYRNFLRATFSPRKGPDGRRYTATHAALLRLPFRAYVTSNYDPALEFARAELRPESLSTGKTALLAISPATAATPGPSGMRSSSRPRRAPPSPLGITRTTPPPPPASARRPGAPGPAPRPSPPGSSSARKTSPPPTPRLWNG